MGSKNISVRDDVYQDLKTVKTDDESFSDVIERLLASEQGEHPLQDLVGILDEERGDELRRHVREFREDVDEEMERHT